MHPREARVNARPSVARVLARFYVWVRRADVLRVSFKLVILSLRELN